MTNEDKTQEELIKELKELRQRVAELEASENERKQAEKALQESEIKYRGLYESVKDGIDMTDMEGHILECNQAYLDMLGYTNEEIKRLSYKQLTPKKWHQMEADIVKNQFIARGYSDEYEKEYIKKDGTVFPIEVKGWLIRDERRKPTGMWSFIRDITERKRAEEALRESEEKYRLLVDNANDAICIAQDEVIKFPNPKTEEMIGYSKEELAKIPFVSLIHPEDRDMVLDRHKRRLKGEEPPGTYSFRMISKAGEGIWVQLNVVLITWEGRPATLNFLRDITPQKRMQAQLQQAQKMEAIGTLAGGIAHDFNNLLMGIKGNASLMLLSIDSDHPHYERLRSIEQCVQSGAELTRQLLGFARGGRYEVKPIDLNELIKRTSAMFGRTKKEIKIYRKYQKGIFTVEVDPGQIEQVLLNLYVNAWEAMPEGGELYLKTENVTLDEDYSKPFTIKPGRYVKVSITDTGLGMDDDTKKRIFDPFFTTKEMGRGTGLGLASVYGIIKNHGGIINVYSEKAEGTTFNIYLPASEKEIKEERKVAEELLKGTETVLLVDDEDIIIGVGSEMLKSLDYDVLIARDGKEAIRLYNEKREKIDIVILDMIMPDIGGGEAYDRLKEINPKIKVLLSSGYSINGQATEILERGCDSFIQKPFSMKQLSQKIREILDK